MAEKIEFWFQYSGDWEFHKFMYYDCYDVDIVSDEVSKMTFERIKNHFLKLGYLNPKGIFIRDPDKGFEDGLYVIKDEESCRRTLQYVQILDASKIEIFVERENRTSKRAKHGEDQVMLGSDGNEIGSMISFCTFCKLQQSIFCNRNHELLYILGLLLLTLGS